MNATTMFTYESCCKCGIAFFMPSDFVVKLKETKQEFCCPNGHRLTYSKSTAETLQEKVDQLNLAKQRLMNENESRLQQINSLSKKLIRLQKQKKASE